MAFLWCAHGEKESSGLCHQGEPTNITSHEPNQISKAPSPNTIVLKAKASINELGGRIGNTVHNTDSQTESILENDLKHFHSLDASEPLESAELLHFS